MGWTFIDGSNLRSIKEERTAKWEASGVTTTCIANCFRGAPTHSGVLWAVWEREFPDDKPTERWITCDLLMYNAQYGGWGYKDMDESMGPYYYNCPMKYLAMVPIVTNQEWRDKVIKHHKRKRASRAKKLLD